MPKRRRARPNGHWVVAARLRSHSRDLYFSLQGIFTRSEYARAGTWQAVLLLILCTLASEFLLFSYSFYLPSCSLIPETVCLLIFVTVRKHLSGAVLVHQDGTPTYVLYKTIPKATNATVVLLCEPIIFFYLIQNSRI